MTNPPASSPAPGTGALLPMPHIGLGHFLPGGVPLPTGVKGVSETYRGLIEVDEERLVAYVKLLHPWEVFNEALGSVLCQLAGLPTPKAYLVLVEREDYPQSPLLIASDAPRALAFASQAMPMQTLGRHIRLKTPNALRELVSRWKEWPDVLVFDQWIANPDRHSGNLLVGGPGEIYLIDHGLSFYRRNWTPAQIEAAISIVTARLWTDTLQGVVTLPERIAATDRAQSSAVRYSAVDSEAAMISTKVSQFLAPEQVQALVRVLCKRCANAAGVICKAMGVPDLGPGDAQ